MSEDPSPSVLRVGAVQMSCQDDVSVNLEKARAGVRRCASQGARVVLLPENFAFMGTEEEKRGIAEDFATPGPILAALSEAARSAGVNITIVSGFRTMAEQQYLYNCYINCNCNNCNLAAKPGYSNHQSGHALDLNTSAAGVNAWLKAHGAAYGFSATVPSEAWHWEWWGGGPPASGPCGVPEWKATYMAQSFPPASEPAVEITMGETLVAWIDLKNTGKQTWTANTKLAPTPRDEASPLFAPSWLSATRITGPDADTPAGQVGRFSFELGAAAAPGEYFQTFGLVEEGVTWFSQAPKGGGPPDDQLEVRIMVVAPEPPPPPPPPATTTGGEGGSSGGSTDAAGSSARA